jgi:hypothetical protein
MRRLDEGRRVPILSLPLLCVLLLNGCTAVVTPPDHPEQPETILLVDNSYHASVVLPASEADTWIRYEYGDWSYFAKNNTGFFSSVAAYAWPTDGGLGRRFVEDRREDAYPANWRDGTHVYEIDVPGERVQSLVNELNREFQRNGIETHYNHHRELTLVRVEWDYWIFHDSNAQVVDWLQALGCEVHGSSFLSDWRVARE